MQPLLLLQQTFASPDRSLDIYLGGKRGDLLDLGTDVTGQDGAATVGPLPPGPIYLYAQCPGYRAEGDNSITIGTYPDDTSELAQTFVFKVSSSVAGVVRWAGG